MMMTIGIAGVFILPAPVEDQEPPQSVNASPTFNMRLDAKQHAGEIRASFVSRDEVRKPVKPKNVVKKSSQKIHKKPTKTKRTYSHAKVPLSGIAACIAKYESGGNPRAQNPRSSASGLYGFIDSTWRAVTGLPGHAKDYSVEVQTRAFYKLWDGGKNSSQWVTAHRCM